MRAAKWTLLILVTVAAIVGAVFASLPKPLEVDSVRISRGRLQVTVDGDGQTRVRNRHVVTSPLYGNIARIDLNPGDSVSEKTVLARITPLQPSLIDTRSRTELELRVKAAEAAKRQSEAAVARARQAAEFAERERTRIEALARAGSLSEQERERAELESRDAAKTLESAQFGARVAQFEVEMARAGLERGQTRTTESFELLAPIPGRVLRRFRESEGVVQPGEQLVEIGDLTALEIVVDVLSIDAVAIAPGAKATIERWGGDTPLNAIVKRVEPAARTKISALGVEEQRVDVILELNSPYERWSALGDGFHVEAKITVWERDDILLVPSGGLHRKDDQWAVFVVSDGKVQERVVDIGHRSGVAVEVLSGLETDDEVIIYPSDRVAADVRVTARAQ